MRHEALRRAEATIWSAEPMDWITGDDLVADVWCPAAETTEGKISCPEVQGLARR